MIPHVPLRHCHCPSQNISHINFYRSENIFMPSARNIWYFRIRWQCLSNRYKTFSHVYSLTQIGSLQYKRMKQLRR